jgi:hypothetical protein
MEEFSGATGTSMKWDSPKEVTKPQRSLQNIERSTRPNFGQPHSEMPVPQVEKWTDRT